jgi:DNA-binding XRE family transcriptional regulator
VTFPATPRELLRLAGRLAIACSRLLEASSPEELGERVSGVRAALAVYDEAVIAAACAQGQRFTPAEAVARRVRAYREARGLTQKQLVERLADCGFRTHRPLVARLETARHTPTLDTLTHYARALGVTVADLVEDLR